jgi:hypothetical protein
MTDWRKILEIAARHLNRPLRTTPEESNDLHGTMTSPWRVSWCAWTTFGRLQQNCGYWTAELPLLSQLHETYVGEGPSWTQPFPYYDIAHLIIPSRFEEHHMPGMWTHEQDIDGLSALLNTAGIDHSLSRYALDIKRF